MWPLTQINLIIDTRYFIGQYIQGCQQNRKSRYLNELRVNLRHEDN